MRLRDALLCLAMDSRSLHNRDVVGLCGSAIAGGADLVRLDVTGLDSDEAVRMAQSILAVCRRDDALLTIADDPTLARAIGADGVHLSGTERAVGEAQSFAGMDRIVGMTVTTPVEAKLAASTGADYIIVGGRDMDVSDAVTVGRTGQIPAYVVVGPADVDRAGDVVERGIFRLSLESDVIDAPDVTESVAVFSRVLGREI